MVNITQKYGKNAGRIWNTLNKHGELTKNTLLKKTGLKKEDFYVAIGWLAKENKIYFDDNTFCLKDYSWDTKIGKNAGKVYDIINCCEEIDVSYIPKLADLPTEDTYFAIGWLAKEGKINAKKVRPKKTQTKIALK